MSGTGQLQRQVGVVGAVVLGLGSIIGTGVFVSVALGAAAAGPAVVLAIVAAAAVATCNGLSSAQLAAKFPVSGGTYEYGYRLLHPAVGFTAGWLFLLAKSASAATAALGFAGYVLGPLQWPEAARVPVALGLVALLTLLVASGLRRSNAVNAAVVGLTLAALGAFVVSGTPDAVAHAGPHFTPFFTGTWEDFCYATALMFVAYTGYGRIATMGEEITEPRRNIPRAMIATLAVSAALYAAVALVGVGGVGAAVFAAEASRAAPLRAAAEAMAGRGVALVVAAGAVTAMAGVLLNLLLGLSRVLLAIGRRGDVPAARRLAAVDERRGPVAATVVMGVVIALLVLVGDVKTTWSFSAFTVLVYYALTNLAALRLPAADRLYPRAFAWAGLAACLALAFFVPWPVWLTGVGLVAAGLGLRAVVHAATTG